MNTCFACGRSFPLNDELEWLATGSMVAFDAARGRLWVVCRWCSHWSLVPIEHRWEAVEELERRAVSAGVLAATDEVSLVQIGSVRAVRIGSALPREEAWWRFGTSLRGRRRRYAFVSSIGGTLAAGATIAGLVAMAAVPGMVEAAALRRFRVSGLQSAARRKGGELSAAFDRRFRFGRYAWTGVAACADCGTILHRLAYRDRFGAHLQPDGTVSIKCHHCRRRDPGHVIGVGEADDLVRRCLSYTNIAGATTGELNSAVDLVRTGSINLRSYVGPLSLPLVPREHVIALELAATERAEALALGWEVRQLEARWRSAEAIAAIVDRELS